MVGRKALEIADEIEAKLRDRAGAEELRGLVNELSNTEPDTNTYPGVDHFHSVCHIFEHYEQGGHNSVLNLPQIFETVAELVNKCAKLAYLYGHRMNLERIIIPLIQYNLDVMKGSLDKKFAFKPKGLERPEFVAMLEMENLSDIETKPELILAAFCRSETPRAMLGELSRLRDSGDEFAASILDRLGIKAPKAGSKAANEVAERLPGIFVDVEGTLIIQDKTGQPALNHGVMGELYQLLDTHKVTIVTGADLQSKITQLKQLASETDPVISLVEKVIGVEIRHKSELKGKVVEMLIDDTAPEAQGLSAEKHFTPAAFQEFMRSEAGKAFRGIPKNPLAGDGAMSSPDAKFARGPVVSKPEGPKKLTNCKG